MPVRPTLINLWLRAALKVQVHVGIFAPMRSGTRAFSTAAAQLEGAGKNFEVGGMPFWPTFNWFEGAGISFEVAGMLVWPTSTGSKVLA